jgi:thiol-disulfide isomerase/thioredoxin
VGYMARTLDAVTTAAPPERNERAAGGGSAPRRGYLAIAAVVAVVALVAVVFAAHSDPSSVSGPPPDVKHLPVKGPAPALDAKGWINSPPLTPAALRGKVVLYDFWTYSCINCQRTIPYLRSWYDRYKSDGLVIVGVHSPEFDFEKVHKNVEGAVTHYGVTWPVALDDDMTIWKAFNNESWPADYLADKTGHIRYTHIGEGDYSVAEDAIRELLAIPASAPRAAAIGHSDTLAQGTSNPETYLGLIYQGAGPPLIQLQPGSHDYQASAVSSVAAPRLDAASDSLVLDPGKVEAELVGKWNAGDEAVTSEAAAATILLGVHAQEVNLVMATKDHKPTTVVVEIDGHPIPANERGASVHEDANGRTVVTVQASDLYSIVRTAAVETHELSVTATAPGLEAYDFTFG